MPMIKAMTTTILMLLTCEALTMGVLGACGSFFPPCDDPKHPCPPMPEPQPTPMIKRDAGDVR